MIFQSIMSIILGAIETIFSILPTVASTPSAIVSAGSWVTTAVSNSIAVLNMIYGATFLSAIMIIIIGIFNFEWIYHSTMWLIRKLPFLSIK